MIRQTRCNPKLPANNLSASQGTSPEKTYPAGMIVRLHATWYKRYQMPYYHEETAAERSLRKELDRRGLDYRQSMMLCGREIDFFFPRHLLAVEIDGFFHCSRNARQRDMIKESILDGQGIHMVRFNNQDILSDTRACGQRIADYIRTRDRNLRRAAIVALEPPLRAGLLAWVKRNGFQRHPEGD